MKVVILAGGFGSRLSEYTEAIPKPMVPIGDDPIIWHIMKWYAHFGHKDFFVALGYKSNVIKDFFSNYFQRSSDFTVDLGSGRISPVSVTNSIVDWKVTLVETGKHSMTGGRLKRLATHLTDEPFLLTYGDGLADVDINKLLKFHKSHGKMVTVTAVRPTARFGELELQNENVVSFREKPQTTTGWINGGYFVVEPQFLDFIEGDDSILESEPLNKASECGEMVAYKHEGFWQCMDTKRDRDFLEKIWSENKAPWLPKT